MHALLPGDGRDGRDAAARARVEPRRLREQRRPARPGRRALTPLRRRRPRPACARVVRWHDPARWRAGCSRGCSSLRSRQPESSSAHARAYAVTGRRPGAEHGYLAHVPQVVGLLASIALARARAAGAERAAAFDVVVRADRAARVRLPGAPRAARAHGRAAVAADDADVPRRARAPAPGRRRLRPRSSGASPGRSTGVAPRGGCPPAPGGAWLPLPGRRRSRSHRAARSARGDAAARLPLSSRPEPTAARRSCARPTRGESMRPAAMLFAVAASALALAGCGGGASHETRRPRPTPATETAHGDDACDHDDRDDHDRPRRRPPRPEADDDRDRRQGGPAAGRDRSARRIDEGRQGRRRRPHGRGRGGAPARLRHREAGHAREAGAHPLHREPPRAVRARAPPPGRAARRDRGQALIAPGVVAHGIGGVQDLPVPTWLFYWGGGGRPRRLVRPARRRSGGRPLLDAARARPGARRRRSRGSSSGRCRIVGAGRLRRALRARLGCPRSSATPTRSGTSRRPGST